jgi:hypothetical protein
MTDSTSPIMEGLHANGPQEPLASKMQLYGRFVGSTCRARHGQVVDGTTLAGQEGGILLALHAGADHVRGPLCRGRDVTVIITIPIAGAGR